jgi:hypothetical protein
MDRKMWRNILENKRVDHDDSYFENTWYGSRLFSAGLDGVLMQEGRGISYDSRKLQLHEENYATHNLKLAVIVHAFKI